MTTSFHKSNLGKFGEHLPCDLNGYVHLTAEAWRNAPIDMPAADRADEEYMAECQRSKPPQRGPPLSRLRLISLTGSRSSNPPRVPRGVFPPSATRPHWSDLQHNGGSPDCGGIGGFSF